MKKKILAVVLLLGATLTLSAQEVKRVAILETVDKYDKVDYGVRLQVRAFITKAVNDTPGFEGYDRADMSQLIKEHDFQRTGMVSDADIKKFGEMTGTSSIVVSEVAAYGSDGRIIITTKVINIETGRIEISAAPRVTSINGAEVERTCREMFYEMFLSKDLEFMEIEELRNDLRDAKSREAKLMNRIYELENMMN